MSTENIDNLIALKFVNEINAVQQQELDAWLSSSEENKKYFQEMQRIWEADQFDSSTKFDADVAWAKVQSSLSETKVIPINQFKIQWWARVAAMFVVVLGIAFIWNAYFSEPAMVTVATNAVETKEVILPDGSHAWLNANSSVSYPERFKGNERNVSMNGEAFFEVTKMPEKAFVIQSNEGYTKVLGTSFNVNARNTKFMVVTVRTGKVEIGTNKKSQVLLPGDQGQLDFTTGKIEVSKIKGENYIAWKTGALVFDDYTIAELADFMETYFEVEVQLSKGIGNCHFTGSFSQPKLPEVLNVLSLTNNIEYVVDGNKVMLSGTPCE